jgi:hypothetical protein
MRTARSCTANLRRRLEALEKSLSLADEACEEMNYTVCSHMGRNELESLIDAMLAHLRGRELTDREAAGKQAYVAALKSECRSRGLAVCRLPDVFSMIFRAATRGWCAQDVTLLLGILDAMLQGFEPTPEQHAARASILRRQRDRISAGWI